MSVKRAVDLFLSIIGILVFFPLVVFFLTLIWLEDFTLPIYLQKRTGANETQFRMIKLRSMRKNATAHDIDTTSAGDNRITKIGSIIRRYKIDELPQLVNVLLGHMSIVGPRPQTIGEAQLYTRKEKHIFSVKPGITDIASIVFMDLQKVVEGHTDPNLAYHQLVRPWKSRFCLFYIEKQSLPLDFLIIGITALCLLSPKNAKYLLSKVLKRYNAPKELYQFSRREASLTPEPPPGKSKIIQATDLKPKHKNNVKN